VPAEAPDNSKVKGMMRCAELLRDPRATPRAAAFCREPHVPDLANRHRGHSLGRRRVPWHAGAGADANADTTLQEVIVTARKRTENLQDVPLSLMVFTSKDLQNQNISQFEDYAAVSPSISFVSAGPGTQTFVMRGVSDGSNPNYANTATTAFLVDDMSMNYYGTTPTCICMTSSGSKS